MKPWISKCSGEGEARLAWDGERVFPCPGTGKEWGLGGPEHPALPQRWRGAVWSVIAALCSLSKRGRSYKSGFWKVSSHSSWDLLSPKVGIWVARALHVLQCHIAPKGFCPCYQVHFSGGFFLSGVVSVLFYRSLPVLGFYNLSVKPPTGIAVRVHSKRPG